MTGMVLCYTGESKDCADQWDFATSINDHLKSAAYWNMSLYCAHLDICQATSASPREATRADLTATYSADKAGALLNARYIALYPLVVGTCYAHTSKKKNPTMQNRCATGGESPI